MRSSPDIIAEKGSIRERRNDGFIFIHHLFRYRILSHTKKYGLVFNIREEIDKREAV